MEALNPHGTIYSHIRAPTLAVPPGTTYYTYIYPTLETITSYRLSKNCSFCLIYVQGMSKLQLYFFRYWNQYLSCICCFNNDDSNLGDERRVPLSGPLVNVINQGCQYMTE